MKLRFTAALCRCYLNLPTFERIGNPSVCEQSVHMFLLIGDAQINTFFVIHFKLTWASSSCKLLIVPDTLIGFWLFTNLLKCTECHRIPDHSVQWLSLLLWSLLFSLFILLNLLNLKELLCIMYNKVGT